MDARRAVRRSPFVFPLACAAALAMVFISEARTGSRWTRSTSSARWPARAQQHAGPAAEHPRRRDRPARLPADRPHGVPAALRRGAGATSTQRFGVLDRYYADEPEPAAVLDKLHTLTAAKLSRAGVDDPRCTTQAGSEAPARHRAQRHRPRADGRHPHARRRAAGRSRRAASPPAAATSTSTLMLSRIGVAALSAHQPAGAVPVPAPDRGAASGSSGAASSAVQAERDRLEIEVRRRTAQLTELAHHLQTAREDERNRLARDLHDELGALLTSAKLDAARIKLAPGRHRARGAGAAGAPGRTRSTASIALGRRIIEDLRPSTLGNLGLVATLEILAREFAERSGVAGALRAGAGAAGRHRRADGLPAGAGGHHQHQQVRQGAAMSGWRWPRATARSRSRCATTASASTPPRRRARPTAWWACASGSRPKAAR